MVFSNEVQAMIVLGVGKNMVRSIRFWVEATGMAELADSGGLVPSALGQLIFGPRGLDPFMEDIQTLWLIHWNLSTHTENRLFAWDFLFSRWQEPDFTESGVLKAFAKEVENQAKRLSVVTLQQHLQVFLHTYVPTRGRKGEIVEDSLDCPLTELELLAQVGARESVEGRYGHEPVYAFRREGRPTISPALFSYCVYDYWEKFLPNEQTVSVRSLATGLNSPGQVFKIPEDDIYARLPDLSVATGGRLAYSESAALPQVHKSGPIKRAQLLAQAYQ